MTSAFLHIYILQHNTSVRSEECVSVSILYSKAVTIRGYIVGIETGQAFAAGYIEDGSDIGIPALGPS